MHLTVCQRLCHFVTMSILYSDYSRRLYFCVYLYPPIGMYVHVAFTKEIGVLVNSTIFWSSAEI